MEAEILVPLDGSAAAEAILPYVRPLAYGGLGRLTLLRVVPSLRQMIGPDWSGTMSVNLDPYHEAELQAAGDYLTALTATLRGEGLPVHSHVLAGDPARALAAYAAERSDLSLIAMVTHGRSGVPRWVFGSVAEALLHAAPAPLLLVRQSDTPPAASPLYRTIVVGLDGSAFAEEALDQAYAVAKATGASLQLVAAAPTPVAYATGGQAMAASVQAAYEDQAVHLRVYLQATAARLENFGLTIDTHLVYGPPAEAILDTAARLAADLIVLATHGRSGWQQVRFGSVALKVVRAADRPVLLVRATPPSPAAADPVATLAVHGR
ncbi:MAG: universal stress protein [Chloroflexota bacterium]|nr:universal stress protein [Chloroflexota bacterium]